MKTELGKKGRLNFDRVHCLMKETTTNRRQWIKDTDPAVSAILGEFPALRDHRMVRIRTYVTYIQGFL